MNQGKLFHFRNQNVRFVFETHGKRNGCEGTESAQNGLDILFAEIPYKVPLNIYLHQVVIKGTCFYIVDKKDNFQYQW